MPPWLGPKDLVDLDALKHLRLEHEGIVDPLGVVSGLSDPATDGAAVEPEGRLDGGDRAAVGDEREHKRDGGRLGLEREERGAGAVAEGLAADGASEAFSLGAVNPNVAARGMTACRAALIGAEALLGVHRRSVLGWQTKRVRRGPPHFVV